jgi:hypothetical protein
MTHARQWLLLALALLVAPASADALEAQARWVPRPGLTFSIALSVAPTTVTTPAQVVDLDLFDISPLTVAKLKRQGKRAICYLSAGSWENWRPDARRFPANVLGKNYDGWAGERWLDIRNITALAPIMRARLDLCKAKRFDAVDPDNVDGYQADTGFPIARVHAIKYVKFLALEAHRRGLALGLKNAGEISRYVLPDVDFQVTEDCFEQGWCGRSRNFIAARKPVFAIEYTDNRIDFAAFCRQTLALKISPLLKRRSLDLWERRCAGA